MTQILARLFERHSVRLLLVFLLLSCIYATAIAAYHFNPQLDVLCKWDCHWYTSIVEHDYVSTVPPVPQATEISNVAFFPLYPALAGILGHLSGLAAQISLPLTSMLCASGFFILLAQIVRNSAGEVDWHRVLLICCYPATFYLWVGYSESAYCFSLLLGLIGLETRSRFGPVYALVSGLSLGLCRLTGVVLAGAVCLFQGIWWVVLRPTKQPPPFRSMLWLAGAIVGVGSFFLFCQLRFGAWDLYFQTLSIGWQKEFNIAGFTRGFIAAIRENVLFPWHAADPIRMSWLITADLLLVYAYVVFLEFYRLWQHRMDAALFHAWLAQRVRRLSLLSGGFVHLLVTTIGDSNNWHWGPNGMRYSMPMFFLLVAIWDDAWLPAWLAKRKVVRQAIHAGLISPWVPFQLYYLGLFVRGAWVS